MILNDEILGKNPASWGKFLLGVLGLPVLFIFVLIPVISILLFALGVIDPNSPEGFSREDASDPIFLLITFMSIGLFHIVLYFFMRWAYGRSYPSLLNPLKRGWKWQVIWGAIYAVALFLTMEIAGLIMGMGAGTMPIERVWQPGLWLAWFLPMAFVVLLQTSAEEAFFRGFIQQYLARLVPSRWIYIGVPSLIWALLHFWNFESTWIAIGVMTSILALVFVFGDWADKTGSLYGPMTVHFINNFYLVMFYGNSLEPSDLNIFQADLSGVSEEVLGVGTMISSVLIVVVYFFVRKRLLAGPPQHG